MQCTAVIEDLSSTGTFVNGVKLEKNVARDLHEGAVISLATPDINENNLPVFVFRFTKDGELPEDLAAAGSATRVLGKRNLAAANQHSGDLQGGEARRRSLEGGFCSAKRVHPTEPPVAGEESDMHKLVMELRKGNQSLRQQVEHAKQEAAQLQKEVDSVRHSHEMELERRDRYHREQMDELQQRAQKVEAEYTEEILALKDSLKAAEQRAAVAESNRVASDQSLADAEAALVQGKLYQEDLRQRLSSIEALLQKGRHAAEKAAAEAETKHEDLRRRLQEERVALAREQEHVTQAQEALRTERSEAEALRVKVQELKECLNRAEAEKLEAADLDRAQKAMLDDLRGEVARQKQLHYAAQDTATAFQEQGSVLTAQVRSIEDTYRQLQTSMEKLGKRLQDATTVQFKWETEDQDIKVDDGSEVAGSDGHTGELAEVDADGLVCTAEAAEANSGWVDPLSVVNHIVQPAGEATEDEEEGTLRRVSEEGVERTRVPEGMERGAMQTSDVDEDDATQMDEELATQVISKEAADPEKVDGNSMEVDKAEGTKDDMLDSVPDAPRSPLADYLPLAEGSAPKSEPKTQSTGQGELQEAVRFLNPAGERLEPLAEAQLPESRQEDAGRCDMYADVSICEQNDHESEKGTQEEVEDDEDDDDYEDGDDDDSGGGVGDLQTVYNDADKGALSVHRQGAKSGIPRNTDEGSPSAAASPEHDPEAEMQPTPEAATEAETCQKPTLDLVIYPTQDPAHGSILY